MFALWTTLPGWQAVGWTMIHFLWMGTLIGLVAFLGRLALHRCRPLGRYVFLTGCFVLLTVAPCLILWHLLGASMSASHPRGSQPIASSDADASSGTESVGPARGHLRSRASASPDSRWASPAAQAWYGTWKRRLDQGALMAPWIWLIGTPLTLLLLSCSLVGTRHLRHHSHSPAEPWVAELSDRLRSALNVGRRVAIAISDSVASPILVGVIKPMILLPPALFGNCTAEQIEMVLLHELAHVQRWDPWINGFQQIAECLLFFHPAVWIVSGWVRVERESCCDEIVLQQTKAPQAYAETLAQLATQDAFPMASSLAMAKHPLVRRIQRILQWRDHAAGFPPVLLIASTLVFLTGLAAAIGMPWNQTRSPWDTEPMATGDASPHTRVLRLPDDRTVGWIRIRKDGDYDTSSTLHHWDSPIDAVGRLEIPAHHQVQLAVNGKAARDLSFLQRLGHDDIYLLDIGARHVNDDNLTHVAHLTGLSALELTTAKISDHGVKHLGRLDQLEYLCLRGAWISDKGISMLARFPALETLIVKGHFTDRAIPGLVKLASLRTLVMTGQVQISSVGKARLAAMPAMRHLRFDGNSYEIAGTAGVGHEKTYGDAITKPAFAPKNRLRVRWSYTFEEVKGSATLDMDGVTIVFEGKKRRGLSQGTFSVGGAGQGWARSGSGDREFHREYSNGVIIMRFGKCRFRLLDGGKRLSIQGREIDLSQGKRRVTVEQDGSVKSEDI